MTLRTVGGEAEECLPEVEKWIAENLPENYSWPGNYRELEQCVRNVIIRRSYRPIVGPEEPRQDFAAKYRAGELTADQVLSHYAAHMYRMTASFEEAARRLGMDRRTVKRHVTAHLASGE
jgi:transcriptional regulator of acetoin/glycerol metabolism